MGMASLYSFMEHRSVFLAAAVRMTRRETAIFTMYSRIVSVGVKSMASAAMTSVARRSSFLSVKTPPTVAGNPEELEFSEHWPCLFGGPA